MYEIDSDKKMEVSDYIAKGFLPTMAAYYASGRKRIQTIKPNEDYTLTLEFDNQERRIYDCRPLLQKGSVFEPLMDIAFFKRAYLSELHTVTWDTDAVSQDICTTIDLCPDVCYVDSVPVESTGDQDV